MTDAPALPTDATTPSLTRRVIAPYAVGIALILAAHGVAVLIHTPSVPAAYSIFVAAVVLTALYGGYGPGLLVTALAGLDLAAPFISSHGSLLTQSEHPLLVATCSMAALLSGSLRRPRTNLLREEHDLLAAAERERRRIGHDLHDGLGQELTGISMLSSALADKLRGEGSGAAAQADQLAALVRDSIRHAHDLAHGLASADLKGNDLVEALDRLTGRLARLPGVTCVLDTVGEPHVDPAAAMHLYRIAQEATGNALRHGQAKTLAISLHAGKRELTLRVADDGRGFSPPPDAADPEAGGGLGLRLMHHRATAVGGTLTIAPRDPATGGGGTVVVCRIGPHRA